MLHPQCYTNLSPSGSLSLPQPHRYPTAYTLTPNLNLFSSSDYQTTSCMISHNRISFSSHASYMHNNSSSSCDYVQANLPSCSITPKSGLSDISNLPVFPVSGSHQQTCLPSCCYDNQYFGNVNYLSRLAELSCSCRPMQHSDQTNSLSYKPEVSNGRSYHLHSYSTNCLNDPSNSTYGTVYSECNRSILPSCDRMFYVPDPMSSNGTNTTTSQ